MPAGRGWRDAARRWIGAGLAVGLFFVSMGVRGESATSEWMASSPLPAITLDADEGHRPTATAGSSEPLGVPQLAPAQPGAYEFLMLQRGSDEPVGYDPCRPIRYVVNERTAPAGTDMLVRDAIETMQKITGLKFVYEGTTDETVTTDRPAFQPARYGDRWAPVLIAWSDPVELPELAGDIAGIGGSTAVQASRNGPAAYVSGLVAIDGPQVRELYRSLAGRLQARGLLLHEFGHLLGLAHVDDPAQLMHGSSGTVDPQGGDVAGLVRLGGMECVPLL